MRAPVELDKGVAEPKRGGRGEGREEVGLHRARHLGAERIAAARAHADAALLCREAQLRAVEAVALGDRVEPVLVRHVEARLAGAVHAARVERDVGADEAVDGHRRAVLRASGQRDREEKEERRTAQQGREHGKGRQREGR